LSEEDIPFFLTTEHSEHTEINPSTAMSCFRVFGVFRGSLLFGDTIHQPQERMCIEKEFHSMVSFISSNGSSKPGAMNKMLPLPRPGGGRLPDFTASLIIFATVC
jgi:hypothetical protein